MSKGDRVLVREGVIPDDYHCRCDLCQRAIGELRPADGSYYSRLERRQYYDPSESGGGHIARTPLHVARWAIQAYSKPGDWVVDPTIGAGTTAVEAITQGRNVAGMEIQYGDILQANIRRNMSGDVQAIVRIGDARTIGSMLTEINIRPTLVVNNPPYSGDEAADGKAGKTYFYRDGLPNLAFLKEGDEYWRAIDEIYRACVEALVPGGHFVIGVKDMMRQKKPYLLHAFLAERLLSMGMKYVGTAFLRHYPGTLFMNTYPRRYGVQPPLYQTIAVLQKPV